MQYHMIQNEMTMTHIIQIIHIMLLTPHVAFGEVVVVEMG